MVEGQLNAFVQDGGNPCLRPITCPIEDDDLIPDATAHHTSAVVRFIAFQRQRIRAPCSRRNVKTGQRHAAKHGAHHLRRQLFRDFPALNTHWLTQKLALRREIQSNAGRHTALNHTSMKNLTLVSALLVFTAAAAQAGPAVTDVSKNAKAIAPLQPVATWGGPILGGGVKTNSDFTEGSLFLVQPLLNTIGDGSTMGGSMFFVEPYGTWAEDGEVGASLGLGFRHLFSDQSVSDARSNTIAGLLTEGFFVGANTFLDYANSTADNSFWQLGFGIEAGTRYLEVRANYYIPLSDDRTISRRTETETERFVHRTTHTTISNPTVSGTQVVQNVNRQTTTRTTTVTTRRTFELFEEPLEGWDLELALLVPGIDRYCDVKLVGGYYGFEGDRSQQSIDGWRAGVEVRPVPAVVLHATWFGNDHLYKDNWLAGVRLEIPLGGGLKEAFTPRRRHLAERLFEPVHRKNSAVTSSGQEEEETSTTTSTGTTSSTSTTTTQNVIGTVTKNKQ